MAKSYQELLNEARRRRNENERNGSSKFNRVYGTVQKSLFDKDMNSWQTEFNNYLKGGKFDDATDSRLGAARDSLYSRYQANAKDWGYNDDNNYIANNLSAYSNYMDMRGEQKIYDSYSSFGKTFSSLVENVNNLTKGANDRFSETEKYTYNQTPSNLDNLSVRDATAIQKRVLGLSDSSTFAGDYNMDGKLNVKDATAVQRHIAGIEPLVKDKSRIIEIAPYRGADAEEYYNNTKKTSDDLLLQGDELAAAYAQYGDVWKEKGFVDDETTQLIENVLGGYKSLVNGVVNAADTDKNYWSKFSSKQDYYAAAVNMDLLDNANLTEERNKLKEMEQAAQYIENSYNVARENNVPAELEEYNYLQMLMDKYGLSSSSVDNAKAISKQEERVAFLEQNQYQYNIKKSLEKRGDFAQISKESTDKDKYNDFMKKLYLNLAAESDAFFDEGTGVMSEYLVDDYYENMTDEEKALAWALYNTNDDRLDTYLGKIKSGVHQRMAEDIDTDSFLGKVQVTGFSVINDWIKDPKRLFNMFTQSEEVMGPDYWDFALQNAKDNSSGFGNFLIDASTTIGNMLPAIAVGTIPVVGPVAGAITMGLDAASSGYQQMIDLGYSSDQATAYGVLSGVAETVTSYLLSGVGKLGGKLTNNAIKTFTAGIDNALARWAIATGTSMLGEFTEEALQTILEPTLQRMAGMDEEDIEKVNWGDVIYSGLLGAFSSLLLEGPSNAGVEVNTKNVGKDISASPEAVNQLKNLGTSLGKDTAAFKLTSNLSDNSSAYQVGRAFQEVRAEIKSVAENASKGLKSGTVQADNVKIAQEAINVLLNGGMLTSSQMSALESVSETNENFKQATKLAQDLSGVSDLASLARAVVSAEKNSENRQKAISKEKGIFENSVDKFTSEYSDLADVDFNDAQSIQELKSDERYDTDESFKKQVDNMLEQSELVLQMEKLESETQKATDFVRSELGMPTKKSNVSSDNNTYYTPTGEQVEIKGVVQAGGELRLLVNKNGKTERVKISDVAFENDMVATAYNMLDELSVPTKYMTSLVNLIDTNGKTKRGSAQIKALAEVFGYGEIGATAQQIAKYSVSEYLTDRQIEMALQYGRSNTVRDTNRAQREIDTKKKESSENLRADIKYNKTKGKKGKFTHDFTSEELSAMRKDRPDKYKVYMTVKNLAKLLPVDIVLMDTTKAKWEKYKNANGFYHNKTVYVDINAEVNGENTVLFTLSHELVHYIKEWSPAKFQVLSDFVFKEFMDNDVSVDELIDNKVAMFKTIPEYKKLSEAELKKIAYEEIVAEACERMLVDSKAVEKLKKQDKRLCNKIKQFITGFFNKIIERYKKLSPSSAEAKLVQEIEGMSEKLQKLFEDALLDATENQRIAGAEKNTANSGVQLEVIQKTNPAQGMYAKVSEDAPKTQNGLPEGVIKYQLKNTDNLSDTELLAQYLERNGQVAQSVLRKVGNIEISNTKAKRLVSSRLREYGVVGSVAKESAEYIATVLEIASHPEVEGRDIVSDITTEIKRAIESTPYEFNVNAEDYAEVVQILKDYGDKRVYLTPDQEAHVREQGYDIKWLRQRLFRKLNIVKKTQFSDMNEIRLDDVYTDLSERFPTIFPTQDSPTRRAVDSSEYAMDIIDKLDFLSTGMSLSVEEAFGDSAQAVATRIMSEIVADVVQEKTNSKENPYVAKLTKKLKENYKKDTQEKLKKQRQKDRARLEEKVKKVKEHNAETLKKARERHQKTELRNKIKKLESELRTSLLKPTANKYIPADMANAVVDILSAVNMDTVAAAERMAKYDKLIERAEKNGNLARADELRVTRDNIGNSGRKITEKLNSIAVRYSNYKKNNKNTHAYDEYLAEMLNGLSETVGDTPIRLMTAEQLQEVYNVFTALNTVITNANKMLLEGKKMRIKDFSKMVKSEREKIFKSKNESPAILQGASKKIWELLKPFYAFENVGSETFLKLFWELQQGEKVAARDFYEAKEFLKVMRKDYKWSTWKFKREEVFELESGKKMQLNLEQKMLIYNMWKDEDARKHITESGFVFDSGEAFRKVKEVTDKDGEAKTDKEGNKKLKKSIWKYVHSTNDIYKLTANDVAKITEGLTKEQKAYADKLEQYLSEVMGAKGNEAFRKLFGYDKFTKKNYTPIQSAEEFVVSLNTPAGEVALVNSSFTKNRLPGANNPIVLRGYETVWVDHVAQMSNYHGLVVPIDNFNKVLNYSEYINDGSLDEAWALKSIIGETAAKYMTDFVKDLNGGAASGKKFTSLPMKLFGRAKKTAVAASLSTAIQQPTAIIRAMSVINPKYFLVPKVTDGKLFDRLKVKRLTNHFETIKKYSEIAILKEIGGFDTGSTRSAKEYINGTHSFMGHVDNAAMWLSTKADEIGWSNIWVAVINEQQAKQSVKLRNLKGEAREKFLKSCGERFNEVIVKTQVYDSVFSRSDLMRSDSDIAKFITSFMGEPITSLNMLRSAVVQWSRGKISKRRAAVIIGSVCASTLMAAAASSFVYAMRDDDEEDEAFLEKWAYHFGDKLMEEINPLNMIPYTRDLWSIAQGFDVSRPDTDLVEDLTRAFVNLSSDNKTPEEKFMGFTGAFANILGIPAKNLTRDAKAIFNLVSDVFDETTADFDEFKEAFFRGAAFGKNLKLSDKEKRERLHTYLVAGNDEEIVKIRDTYTDDNEVYDDKKFHSEIRTMLREHDTRIKEAAQAHIDGDIKRRGELTEEIYNGYSNEYVFLKDIKSAINSEIDALLPKKDKNKGEVEKEGKYRESLYTTDDVNAAFDAGDDAYARVFITNIISAKTEEYIAKGQVKEDAEKEAKNYVRNAITRYWKPLYIEAYSSADYTEMRRIENIVEISGVYVDPDDAIKGWQDSADDK